MVKSKTPGAPWSIKGVSELARARAKKMAAKQGMTIGQFLTQRIQKSSRVSEKVSMARGHTAPEQDNYDTPTVDAIHHLTEEIESLKQKLAIQ